MRIFVEEATELLRVKQYSVECGNVLSPVMVYFGSRRERESWNWAWVISTRLARQVGYLELLLKLMFVNPPELPEQTTRALPVR